MLNLCVDSALSEETEESAMIAFHFRTEFKHHNREQSTVTITCKRGPNKWDDEEEIENTWIDDDGKIKHLLTGEFRMTNTNFYSFAAITIANFSPTPNQTLNSY